MKVRAKNKVKIVPVGLDNSVPALKQIPAPSTFVENIKKRMTSTDVQAIKVQVTMASDVSKRINILAAALGVSRNALYIAILEAFVAGKGIDYDGKLRDFA